MQTTKRANPIAAAFTALMALFSPAPAVQDSQDSQGGESALPAAPRAAHALRKSSQWGPRVFEQIEWRRFQQVCELLFAQAGFSARSQPPSGGKGVDIFLHSRHADSLGPVAVVQCRHDGQQVDLKQVRHFQTLMASHKVRRGLMVTSATFTEEAQTFARQNAIKAMDGAALLAQIGRRSEREQKILLNAAYEGEYWRPSCPACGAKMAERSRSQGGVNFWGCARYPTCSATMPMRS